MTLGTVVVGGGSGFIGKSLSKSLCQIGYNVLIVSRQPGLDAMSWNDLLNEGLPRSCIAVVNLAGQNVLDPKRRWTEGFKQNVYSSRVRTTALLADSIKKMEKPPKIFATISGVGFYEQSQTEQYNEDSPGGDHDYFSQLCASWEGANNLPKELETRRVIIRSGIVLGRRGGMIQQLFWPFYFGLGGPIGHGNQYMPWIYIDDLVGIFIHAIQNENVKGILNAVAPQVITNREFVKAFAGAMWRPSIIKLPEFALKLAFGVERAKMMTEGQIVIPKKTLETGYVFKYPDIQSACRECARVFADSAK